MSSVLVATFVRRRGRHDRIYVARSDGTTTGWDFPGYGDGLPHDLCHLVVEDELGIQDGFWGLVASGVGVALVDGQATLMRRGRALGKDPGVDLSGLAVAEAAVAVLCGLGLVGSDLDDYEQRRQAALGAMDTRAVERIRGRLADLSRAWADVDDGGSIRLSFQGDADPAPADPSKLPSKVKAR